MTRKISRSNRPKIVMQRSTRTLNDACYNRFLNSRHHGVDVWIWWRLKGPWTWHASGIFGTASLPLSANRFVVFH
jgi:hypothetical protein